VKYVLFTGIALAGLVIDQLTKLYIDGSFRLHESVTVFENFFHITYVRNPGAAFGMLADSPWRVPFFLVVALVASAGILWYLHRSRERDFWLHGALALIFSGAVGNLIDRVRLGEVIDFLDVHWYRYHWPAFNVADSAITVGVGILIVHMWLEEKAEKNARKDSPEA